MISHPDRIGPYRIVRILGQGGMGLVYEAEQLEPLRRTVALEVIRHGMDPREVLARFDSERQALASWITPTSRGRWMRAPRRRGFRTS